MELRTCNICGIDNTRFLFELHDPTTDTGQSFPVVRCTQCGLIYLNPRPTVSEIAQYYPPNFVSYQFEVSDINTDATLRDRCVSFITRSMNVERIRSISRVMNLSTGTNALDVGCGKGAFLYYLKKARHCAVQGLDFDDRCLDYCEGKLGIDVIKGDLDSCGDKINSPFDLITLWAFLEHDFDPMATLLDAHRHLKDEGIMVIEVPNVNSLENIIFGKRSFLYDAPRHLYNFSPSTLIRMLDKAGFEAIKTVYPVGAGGWLGSIQRLLTRDRVYQDLRNHLPFLFIAGALVYPLEFILSFTRLGSVIRVFAAKKRSQ